MGVGNNNNNPDSLSVVGSLSTSQSRQSRHDLSHTSPGAAKRIREKECGGYSYLVYSTVQVLLMSDDCKIRYCRVGSAGVGLHTRIVCTSQVKHKVTKAPAEN